MRILTKRQYIKGGLHAATLRNPETTGIGTSLHRLTVKDHPYRSLTELWNKLLRHTPTALQQEPEPNPENFSPPCVINEQAPASALRGRIISAYPSIRYGPTMARSLASNFAISPRARVPAYDTAELERAMTTPRLNTLTAPYGKNTCLSQYMP